MGYILTPSRKLHGMEVWQMTLLCSGFWVARLRPRPVGKSLETRWKTGKESDSIETTNVYDTATTLPSFNILVKHPQ